MGRFRGGWNLQKMADRSAPLQSVRIKMWPLTVTGNSVDRGVVKRGRLREIRGGRSDCQEREQSHQRKKRPALDHFALAAPRMPFQ